MIDLTELEEELFDGEEEDDDEDDDEEDSQATQSEAELEFVDGRQQHQQQQPPPLPGPVKREGVFDNTGASPAQTRRRVQMEEDDEDDVEVVEIVEPGPAAVAGVGANDGYDGGDGAASAAAGYMAMLEEDGGGIDAEIEEDAEAMDVAAPVPAPVPARVTHEDGAGVGGVLGRPASGASLSQTIEVIDISDDEAETEVEEEASGMAVAQQQTGQGPAGGGAALLEELLDALEDLRDEGFLEREEQRQLRNRATLQDPAVVEAFLGAKRAGGDANAMARAFRRVLGGAM